MKNINWELLIFQVIIAIIIVFLIIFFIKIKSNLKLEKRFSYFSLNTLNEEKELSFLDYIFNKLWKFVHNYAKFLNHFKCFRKYGLKYEKYIPSKNKFKINGTDYVVIKFITGLIVVLVAVIYNIINRNNINFLIYVILFLFSYTIVDILLDIKFKRKIKNVKKDLYKTIIIMNNSFKSGKTILKAVDNVRKSLTGDIADEYNKIYTDLCYGLSIESAFQRFYERVKIEQIKYIVLSISILNKSGCNINEIFNSIEKNDLDDQKINNTIKTQLLSSKLFFNCALSLPIILVSIIFIINRNYFNPFIFTIVGVLFLILLISLYLLYIILIKKIFEVDIDERV